MLVVYFSSATENTHRFVRKLGFPAQRIPLRPTEEPLVVDEPYVLVCPTYGGGTSVAHGPGMLSAAARENSRPVPRQVQKFLNNPHNRSLIRAVIAGGNSNFGADFGKAGDIIAAKCQVPYVYRYELMGTDEDVRLCQEGLRDNADRLGLIP